MFYYHGKVLRAARWKQWKLHLEVTKSELGGAYKKLENPMLFNVEHDPSERYDISDKHPDIIQKIQAIIEEHNASLK